MKRAILSKKKLKFIDGSFVVPNRNEPLYDV